MKLCIICGDPIGQLLGPWSPAMCEPCELWIDTPPPPPAAESGEHGSPGRLSSKPPLLGGLEAYAEHEHDAALQRIWKDLEQL